MKTIQKIGSKKQLGATMVEYALLVALVAMVAIVGVTAMGTSVDAKFSTVAEKLAE
ncbi:MAG: Flp family type IVb pilin [Sinobacterium sp.]|nr:Flp family type IVb pilin [Sinobacterium sp.]